MDAQKRIEKITREDDLKQKKMKSGLEFNPGLVLFPKTWFPQVRKCSGNEKKFFKVREESGNFTSSQGKFKSEKGQGKVKF